MRCTTGWLDGPASEHINSPPRLVISMRPLLDTAKTVDHSNESDPLEQRPSCCSFVNTTVTSTKRHACWSQRHSVATVLSSHDTLRITMYTPNTMMYSQYKARSLSIVGKRLPVKGHRNREQHSYSKAREEWLEVVTQLWAMDSVLDLKQRRSLT